ncbi:MAG: 1-(5-phosphoribosyl)-5-[(5-phosphoribosylamino)methylideneamino]imidazole-4-carboxamide isomerase [Thermogutta sp.]
MLAPARIRVVEIWPAIDLRGGKCVRLRQGDYGQETVFGDYPAKMALHWVAQGAKRLHLVDLDAARSGSSGNLEAVRQIRGAVSVPIQLGGGVRSEETIRGLLNLGLDRLVVGTVAVNDPEWFCAMTRMFPGKLVLGLDARDGRLATDGWQRTSQQLAADFAARFQDEPIAGIVYTDISRDGMLTGPNVEATAAIQKSVGVPVIASGGVSRLDDVRRLSEAGIAGCIIGRAIYEGRVSLSEAMKFETEDAP